MPFEMSKATKRRKNDWRFRERWFVGRGLDIGCGPDKMAVSEGGEILFPRATEIIGYDRDLGHIDAMTLPEIRDGEFDFVVSSHCLEHLRDPRLALLHWLRVVKKGGYVVAAVPDEILYEHGEWPSKRNGDHKFGFSLRHNPKWFSKSVISLLWEMQSAFANSVDVELVQLLTEGYEENLKDESGEWADQTAGPAECAIEFVLRKA